MKKLTYLVASLLTTATVGMTFTGCIDNDEPYGIEQLRGAKAELLKSKKALIEADAQYKLALAEAEKVKAAAEAAKFDAERAKTEAEIAEIRQRMDDAARIAEQTLQNLKVAYEQALLAYEKERLELSQQQQTILDGFYRKYFTALNNYNEKYMEYVRAQKDLVANALDPDGIAYDAKKRVEDAVANAQKALDDAQANIEDYNEQLADAKTWKPSELGAKLTAYQDQVEENTEKMKLIDLTIAENNNESEEGKALVAAKKALDALYNEEVEIPAYTFNADGAITIPGLTEPEEVIGEGWSYTWNSQYGYHGYNDAFNRLGNFKNSIRRYVLDDNDVEWTKAEINNLEAEKKEKTAEFDNLFAGWKMFADAYNVGAAPKYDAIIGYDELKKAVDAYNAQVPATQAAKDAYYAAQKAAQEAWDAYNEKNNLEGDAWSDYYEAVNAANEAYNKAVEAANNELDKTITALNNAVVKAQQEKNAADSKYMIAQGLADKYDDNDLKEAALAALKVAEDAAKALETAEKARDEQAPKAQAKAEKANDLAAATRDNAITDAEKARKLAINDAPQIADPLLDAANAADNKVNEAQDAYNEAWNELSELVRVWDNETQSYTGVYGAIDNQVEEINKEYQYEEEWYDGENWHTYTWMPASDYSLFYQFENEVNGSQWDAEVAIPECSVADVCAYSSSNMKYNIIALSNKIYGSYYYDKNDDDILGIPSAQLIPLTKDDIDKMLAKYGVDEINYPNSYNYYFGLFGITLYYDNRIEVANAYITNKPAIEAAFEDVQTQIDNLVASREELSDKIDEAGKAVEAAQEAVDELNADSWAEYYELQRQNDVADKMIIAISAAAEATGVAQTEQWTQETIDAAIENIEQSIKDEEESIPDLEEALARAKYILDQYEKGLISSAELAALDVEEAKLAMDAAKEKLDAAKARLDAAIKSVENAE
ncbi:hypothetical protein [Muribaculum gordoncarteri]|jgi:hypothetical protein|uniref:Uncharacterized protein n=3 Tax=Muribaculum TaxID=1918540 RepID=A0A4P7VCI6_9BACT|nr:hypothetical protein [Muribaculum gordoncarteri]QCD34404.1 hypothetical protein E7746_00140 [Muribaculum gordoncarteri]